MNTEFQRTKRTKFNFKRRIAEETPETLELCAKLVQQVKYGGNPKHKKNPGDFDLNPPADPRPNKSLCDIVSIFSRKIALQHLRRGLELGLVSNSRVNNKWPKNIWSLTENGEPLEAQLENPETGTYHGYPMTDSDPFRESVIKEWERRNGAV